MTFTQKQLNVPYPWQLPHWQRCIDQIDGVRFPHALLLTGQAGVGKRHFANSLANYLLCQHPVSHLPCGRCRHCELIQADTHPDKMTVGLVDNAKQIKIDQIRQLSSIVKTAQLGGRKVIVLEPLEFLNINAANALLKNLEEPPADTHFILVADVLNQVMATIISRCQLMYLSVPPRALALKWLQDQGYKEAESHLDFMGGAPLKARELLVDETEEGLCIFLDNLMVLGESHQVDISFAKPWQEIELNQLLDWWLRLIQRLIARRSYEKQVENRFVNILQKVENQYNCLNRQWLFRFMDKLFTIKKLTIQGANANKQLLFEELLMDWWAIIKSSRLERA